jgi:hypothetical protein
MSTLKVSLFELAAAFLNLYYAHHYWLKKQTREMILLDDEVVDGLRAGEDLSDGGVA